MSVTITKSTVLEVRESGCGHWVALEKSRWEYLEQTGEGFWCPFGHNRAYLDPENRRLQRQLTEAQEVANRSRQGEIVALKMLDAERKATKRLLRRVNAGVCIHCHRTFKQLARHMASKHQEAAR